MNLELWQSRFREYLRLRNSGERTMQSYVAELRSFFAFLDSMGIDSLGRVTRDAIEEYRNYLYHCTYRGQRLSVSTQSYRLSALKAFMRYLARERFIVLDPAADVECPRVPRKIPRAPLTEKEAARFLEACGGGTPLCIRNRAILEVLYSTAIRNSELCDLLLDSVDFERCQLQVTGKGRKTRVLPLGEEALSWLREYLQHARPRLVRSPDSRVLFLSQRGRQMLRGPLAKMVANLARKAGLKKRVTPHLLRNCCLTHMLKNGADLRHLQEIAGHSSAETTQRYTRVEVSNLRRVLQRCHPRERKRS